MSSGRRFGALMSVVHSVGGEGAFIHLQGDADAGVRKPTGAFVSNFAMPSQDIWMSLRRY